MEDVTRKRIMRKLESLPEEQLYQILDYIEFIEARYAARRARKPDAFQQFAERVEDQMRVRSLAPKAMKGTMKLMSTASRVFDGVRDLGRDILSGPAASSRSTPTASSSTPALTRSASPAPSKPAEPPRGPASGAPAIRLETGGAGESPPSDPSDDAEGAGAGRPEGTGGSDRAESEQTGSHRAQGGDAGR